MGVSIAYAAASGDEYIVSTYYQTDSAETLDVCGDGTGVIRDTGKPQNIKKWYAAEVTNDQWDDLIQVNTTDGHTYAYVYASKGDGSFDDLVRWTAAGTAAEKAFIGDTTGGGVDDLILGYKNGDDEINWYVYRSDGSDFGSADLWGTDQDNDTFGNKDDVFRVGDFNGDRVVEILRGRENTSECGTKLYWKRLNIAGQTEHLLDDDGDHCWGYESSQYLVGDVDHDGSDELVQIQFSGSEAGVFVSDYSSGALSTNEWAEDVGGEDGTYYLFDVNHDDNPDIVRWTNEYTVVWMQGHGSITAGGFDDQSSQLVLKTGIVEHDHEYLIFGSFGNYNSSTYDAAGESPDDDTGSEDTEPEPDYDAYNDGQDSTAYGGTDCNDSNASVYYGAPEVCGNGVDDDCVGGDVPCGETYCYDGVDNDLDGRTDCDDSDCTSSTWCTPVDCDVDCDGRDSDSADCGGTDCDDSNASIYAGAIETCGNGIDEDCDGSDTVCSETNCSDSADNDSDGYTDCDDPDCTSDSDCTTPTSSDYDGDGYDDDEDCGWWSATIYPGAPELANWVDDDCDGSTDEDCSTGCGASYWSGCEDDFRDFYTTSSLTHVCTGAYTGPDYDGDGFPDSSDCAWWDATSYSGAPERSDWNDNDCDGTVDEGCDNSCWGSYASGCSDDYEWWYLGSSTTAPICY